MDTFGLLILFFVIASTLQPLLQARSPSIRQPESSRRYPD
jgi:hypothetical protein